MALESARSSTWMLKSSVIRNSLGEVATDEMRVWKSSRNWEKDTECRFDSRLRRTIDVTWSQIRVRKFDCDWRQFRGFKSSSRCGEKFARLRRRNAVAPPTIEEVHELGTGRGVKMKRHQCYEFHISQQWRYSGED